jgi:hypothetical protein
VARQTGTEDAGPSAGAITIGAFVLFWLVCSLLAGEPLSPGPSLLLVVFCLRLYDLLTRDSDLPPRRVASPTAVPLRSPREPARGPSSLAVGVAGRLVGGRRTWHGRETVDGRRGGVEVSLIVGRDGRLELHVRPRIGFAPLDLEPAATATDPRIAVLARSGCTRVRTLGELVVARIDRFADRTSVEDVIALIDQLLDVIATPPVSSIRLSAAAPEASTICPWCRDEIAARDPSATRCSRCSTRHHTDCFKESGGCTVHGCAGGPARASVRA